MNDIEYTVTNIINPYCLQCTGEGPTIEVLVAWNNTHPLYICRLIYKFQEVARVYKPSNDSEIL